ncbi:MAG: LAGLIDADG family homing endonuclease [Patescibacteria group bacterium]|nr:LAGLIDADG family homing endonuclease [Patescibacteria group bacterium]
MVDLSLIKLKNLWYVIGLITADGNLSTDGRHINITSKEIDSLQNVKNALKINNKIGRKARAHEKRKKYFVLQIGDIRFYRYLLNIGLTQRKSLSLKELQVPNDYFLDFLRGVIDGDGSISTWLHRTNGNTQWSLRIVSGSSIFLQWLKTKTEQLLPVKGKLYGYKYPSKNNLLYILKFGKFPAKLILKQCYYKGCVALRRKLHQAQKCIKSKDGLSKYGNVITR